MVEHVKTACRTGQKTGKSTIAAALALWWALTRYRAQVLLTAPSGHQISDILWPELTRLYYGARLPLGGRLYVDPAHGWKLGQGRRVFAVTTDDAKKLQGVSGANQLIVIDEASGFDDRLQEALEGNMMGGGRMLAIGNPNEASGFFYRAFTSQREHWSCIHVSSEETPNAVEGRTVIPGLAERSVIEQRAREWGRDSALFAVRVRGEFPTQSSDTVIGVGLVEAAIKRWPGTEPTGALHLGVDVARFGDDWSIIQARRGLKAYPIEPETEAVQGFDNVQVAGRVKRSITTRRVPGERVLVKIDGTGTGSGVVDVLRAWNDEGELGEHVEIIDVNAASAATDEQFRLLRDQLWWGIREWLRDGGALPPDDARDAELTAPKYGCDPRGRIKVESKDELRKRLPSGRSPDRADALALSIYGGAMLPVENEGEDELEGSRWDGYEHQGYG